MFATPADDCSTSTPVVASVGFRADEGPDVAGGGYRAAAAERQVMVAKLPEATWGQEYAGAPPNSDEWPTGGVDPELLREGYVVAGEAVAPRSHGLLAPRLAHSLRLIDLPMRLVRRGLPRSRRKWAMYWMLLPPSANVERHLEGQSLPLNGYWKIAWRAVGGGVVNLLASRAMRTGSRATRRGQRLP